MSASSFLNSILLSPESKRRRFAEPTKFVPVTFVFSIITTIYMCWVFLHCVPMLQSWTPPDERDQAVRRLGIVQLFVFHVITGMLLFCYGLSMLTHPGEIPDDDVQWNYIPQDTRVPQANSMAMNLQETKRSGDRRHCKWCSKYKPDRCHHCRACRTCVLRMDHHCPWIYNCVGHRNYKYFFLLLFYSAVDLHFIVWSMLPTLKSIFFNPDILFVAMFFILFASTLALFLGCLVSLFWCFHVWLMLKAMTTIEFCEKSLPKTGASATKSKPSYDGSVYNLGAVANVKTVLGENPLLWLLPCSLPTGDGLNYVSDKTRLTTDMDAVKGIRRKGHQRVQRYGTEAPPFVANAVAS